MFKLGRLKENESGQVGVIFALATLPLIALTSAALEYSKVSKERNAVLSALDAAVLAAASNNAIPDAEKDQYAKTHFLANYSGDVEMKLSPSVTTDRVRLSAEGELALTFGNIVGIENLSFVETSAATLKTENTICVLSLSEDADGAIAFDDNLAFMASNCSVHANSKSDTAILSSTRSAIPKATSFCAVGGVKGEVEPHSKGECTPVADPYEIVPPAKIGECKSEFLLENTSPDSATKGPEGDESDREAEARLRDLYAIDQFDPANFNPSENNLPYRSPIPIPELIAEFERRNQDELLGGSASAIQEAQIEALAGLTGVHLRDLLAVYDSLAAEFATCGGGTFEQSGCAGFQNPFGTGPGEAIPSRSLVADVFDISYGFYYDEPEAELPDIVTNGTVELINGELFSRNNIDNELIPVSSNLSGGNVVLTPGTYCGGLTVDGISVRFTEGDYIFKDGPLTFLNKSQAKADKVTFGFTGTGATLNIESGSSLKIRAATTGPRTGLAFMQMVDSSAPGNRKPVEAVNRIASGGSVTMAGTAYFPEQTLMISGEDTHLGSNSPAVGLIADKVLFRGQRGARVEIGVDHVKAGIPPIQPQADDGVRLIE